MAKPKSRTLSVGETAKRLGVSPDTVRNYCEQGLLQCSRTRGNHRRILIRSIEALETERGGVKPKPLPSEPRPQRREMDEDFEIYYEGNGAYPNELDRGFICNSSFFDWIWQGSGFSSILINVAKEFGGGTFKLLRVRDGEVISMREVELPGPTNDFGVIAIREMLMDPW